MLFVEAIILVCSHSFSRSPGIVTGMHYTGIYIIPFWAKKIIHSGCFLRFIIIFAGLTLKFIEFHIKLDSIFLVIFLVSNIIAKTSDSFNTISYLGNISFYSFSKMWLISLERQNVQRNPLQGGNQSPHPSPHELIK